MNTFRRKTRNILLLFTILVSGCGFAQTYMPLPDSNAIWSWSLGDSERQELGRTYIPGTETDTVINGLTYVKLFSQSAVFFPPFTPWPEPSYISEPHFSGAFRSDISGRSYLKCFDSCLFGEEILYMDLTVELGDTIKQLPTFSSYDYNYIYSDLLVDSIDYIEIGPYTRKRIMLTNLNPPWGMECDFHWVEGFGNVTSGFFNAVGCGLENVGLTCMSINDTIWNTWDLESIPGNCYYPYTSVTNPEEIKIPLLVYPSPARDYVIFEQHTAGKNGTITINDITGRSIAAFQLSGEKTKWETSGLKPGIYLYRLQTPKGSAGGKLIITP